MNIELKANKIKVFSPASVANVACGFDTFGFALNTPGDEVILEITDKPGVRIKKIIGNPNLPKDAEKNTAGLSVKTMLEYLKAPFGVEIILNKKMPIASGLGSSAASAVSSVFALNSLFKKPLDNKTLIQFAIAGETLSTGKNVNLDNIAACLYGGFTIVRSISPVDIIKIPVPDKLYCGVIHPCIELRTEEMRKVLKKTVPLKSAITQWSNAASLIAGLMKSDYELIGRSLQDVIVEPVRAQFIPHFYELKESALNNGALGCSISGSGPSVFTLCKSEKDATNAGNAMKRILTKNKIKSNLFISKINVEGPKIIK